MVITAQTAVNLARPRAPYLTRTLPGAIVDVHVIDYKPNRFSGWLVNALKSLWSEPVNIYVFKGEHGNVGAIRAAAYGYGVCDYVSWLDDDDAVTPGLFRRAAGILDADPDLVSTYNWLQFVDEFDYNHAPWIKPPWDPLNMLFHSDVILHTHVMRRDDVERVAYRTKDMRCQEEFSLMCYMLERPNTRHHCIPSAMTRFRMRDRRRCPTLPLSAGGQAIVQGYKELRSEVRPILRKAIAEERKQPAFNAVDCDGGVLPVLKDGDY